MPGLTDDEGAQGWMGSIMTTPSNIEFLSQMYDAAKRVGHRWPAAAACEAAQETGWGLHMPPNSHNVLGIKAFLPTYQGPWVYANGTEQRPNGSMTGPQLDRWRAYPNVDACFADQVRIVAHQLDRDGSGRLAYRDALAATNIKDYITAECRVWSTGILKGLAVLEIYTAHRNVFV